MLATSTLCPVAPGSQGEHFTSPAPSPTPSHCSSVFDGLSVESFINGWENQCALAFPKSTENYAEGLPVDFYNYNPGASSTQHESHGHHRSQSCSSTLSWSGSFSSPDFGIGLSLDQAPYNQGAPETLAAAMPSSSGAGSPGQLESTHAITLTPPPEPHPEPLIMNCPLPYCAFQSTNLTDIWRHMTWDHIGNKTHCPPDTPAMVEKAVIGSGFNLR
jgi:hypothetical protein